MSRPSARPWLGAAAGLAAIGWGANQFASLIVLYRQDLGVSATGTGAMFGLYAVGLVPGLLIGGRWSDRAGRRVVLTTALLASAVGSAVLMLGGIGEGWLYLGRLVAGGAAGLGFASGTAWVAELTEAPANGPRRATVAMTVGFAAGPLIAGLVAAFAPAPEATAYLPHLVAVALALVAVLRTSDRARTEVDPDLPPPPGIRTLVGHYLAVQVPLAPWVFGSAAVSLAFLPGIVAGSLGGGALVFSAAITGLTAFSGILAQPIASRLVRGGRRTLVGAAMGAVVLGLLAAILVAATASPAVAPLAAVLLGIAFGVTQFTGLREVHRVADPRALGLATAIYQVLSYVGFVFPLALSAIQVGAGLSAPVVLGGLLAVAVVCTLWLTLVLPRLRWGRD